MSIANTPPVVKTGHDHGIHCCHVIGRDVNRWCAPCLSSFHAYPCEDGSSLHDAYARYKYAADLHLVETVLGQVEATILPCPPAYEDALLEVVDWVEEDDQLVPYARTA